jgi:hypothetical protein
LRVQNRKKYSSTKVPSRIKAYIERKSLKNSLLEVFVKVNKVKGAIYG